MNYYIANMPFSPELRHFGIKGQRWGIRRWQNADGSFNEAGKERYGRVSGEQKSDLQRMAQKDAQRQSDARAAYGTGAGTRRKLLDKELNEKMKNPEYKRHFDEASKHVDVNRSLKRAESLHRRSGTFERGQRLSDSGKTVANTLLKTVGGAAVTGLVAAASSHYFYKQGDRTTSGLMLVIGGASVASTLTKGTRDSYQINYYERNKKF